MQTYNWTRFFNLSTIAFTILWTYACVPTAEKLPYLGGEYVDTMVENGQKITKVNYHQIGHFEFINQLGQTITEKDVEGKIYIADFFFTTCPTICPIMKKEMLRVYEHFKENPKVKILSHSIDPEHDNVAVLKDYAERLEIDANKWAMLTTKNPDYVYEMAEKHYLVSANADENAPGGYIHSGAFILVDGNRHIRGYYDGTKTEDVDRLIRDVERLLAQEYSK